jgi:type IV secretion system protein VirB9
MMKRPLSRLTALALGFLSLSVSARAEMPRYDSQGVYLLSYGSPTVPTVLCSPTKVCEIVLEQDETVFKIYSGDTVRWIINPGYAGSRANIPTILFKPIDVGTPDDPVQTNLIITTNRRTYEVDLLAVKKTPHTRYGFTYPQEQFMVSPTVNSPDSTPFHTPAPVQPEAMPAPPASTSQQMPRVGPPKPPDSYRIEGFTDYKPIAVWNDGTHTYVEMPPKAQAPSIYTESSTGTLEMINFHPPIDNIYTIDGTPNHIVLIGNIGKHVPHIDILRN